MGAAVASSALGRMAAAVTRFVIGAPIRSQARYSSRFGQYPLQAPQCRCYTGRPLSTYSVEKLEISTAEDFGRILR
jgi:hypothetical protein